MKLKHNDKIQVSTELLTNKYLETKDNTKVTDLTKLHKGQKTL